MACCLTAPSHYLNQCWLIINKVEWHPSKGKFTWDASAINHWNYLENQVPKISFKFPRGQWVNQKEILTHLYVSEILPGPTSSRFLIQESEIKISKWCSRNFIQWCLGEIAMILTENVFFNLNFQTDIMSNCLHLKTTEPVDTSAWQFRLEQR